MIQVDKKYNLAQLVELIGTEKQKEQMTKKGKLQSKSKQALLKELDTVAKYIKIKENRKDHFIITEIFENKKIKEDRRFESRILYPNAKDLLIYNLFETNNFSETIYFNKTQVMCMAGFARKGFEFILNHRNDYAKKLGVDQKVFSSAIDSKYSYTRSKVDTALNQLKRDRIIENWKDVIYVYGAKKLYMDGRTNYELNSEYESILRNIRERIAKEQGYNNYFMAMKSDNRNELKQLVIEEFNEQTGLGINNYRTKVAIIRLDKELLKSRKSKTYNKMLSEQVKELCKVEMEETYKFLKKKGIEVNDIFNDKRKQVEKEVKISVEYLQSKTK